MKCRRLKELNYSTLDVNANKFTKPKISGTPPAPRYSHSAVLAGSKIIIFGGRGAKGFTIIYLSEKKKCERMMSNLSF